MPAALVLLSVLGAGCGKSNLVQGGHASSASRAPDQPRGGPSAKPVAPAVAIPLKLTPARADAFARAVNLKPVDVTGSHRSNRPPSAEDRQEEKEQCSHAEAQAIGGGRSPRLDRGSQLEAESISSSVVVLPSAKAARADLAYDESTAGLHCYSKLLGRKLARESNASVSIGRVLVQQRKLRDGAAGIRITARISGVQSGLALSLYVDALAFQYGPAEVELYATSFVQPVATRTEQELIDLMRARARLGRL